MQTVGVSVTESKIGHVFLEVLRKTIYYNIEVISTYILND